MYTYRSLWESKGSFLNPQFDFLGMHNLRQLERADRGYVNQDGPDGNFLDDFLAKHGEKEAEDILWYYPDGLGLVRQNNQVIHDRVIDAVSKLNPQEQGDLMLRIADILRISLKEQASWDD